MDFITIIIVFMFLVFFHELGHFIAAKKMGVYVERFSIGFSMFGLFKPMIIKKYKETEYHLYPTLFLGGYVQMKGQDDSDPSKRSMDSDSYNAKHPAKRIIILLAGPFANILLAWILFLIIGISGAQALSSSIGDIQKNSPAYLAKLQTNDKIISINGEKINTWRELGEKISTSNGTLIFTIKRNNKIIQKNIVPKILDSQTIFREATKKRMIGISPNGEIIKLNLSLFESFQYANDKTIQTVSLITQSIQKLIVGVIPSSEVGSVVSIGKVISQASDVGILAVLSIMALISINLGVLNLLPIPALDGGHLVFNLYELITKRAPSPQIFTMLTIIGWVLLFSLMGLGLYNDFNRLIND